MDNTHKKASAISHPIRLRIYDDELLTSYLSRLAHSQGVVVHTLAVALWGNGNRLSQDIDRSVPTEYLKVLREHYGVDRHQTLENDLAQLRCDDRNTYQDPNLLNLCLRGRMRNKAGQQYCPACLVERCYFRRSWRLSIHPVCTEHHCLLLNRCPHCSSVIDPTKTSPMSKDIGYCAFCWNNLRVDNTVLEFETPKLLLAIQDSVKTGWFEYENLRLRACIFMQGLWRIVYALYGIRSEKLNIWETLCSSFGTNYQPLTKNRPYYNFKDESPEVRLKILSVVDRLLVGWPDTFIAVGKELGLGISHFDPANKGMPYWLDEIVRRDLNKGWYRVNTEEMQSCLLYMQKNQIPITRSGLARELGLDVSKKLSPNEKLLFEEFRRRH